MYLQVRLGQEAQSRVEVHRAYMVLGDAPGESVETALICEGESPDASSLGTFSTGWTSRRQRVGLRFKPSGSVDIRAQNVANSGGRPLAGR